MTKKILPCKCGGKGKIIEVEPPPKEKAFFDGYETCPLIYFAVRCEKCGNQTSGYDLKPHARRAWNRMNTQRITPEIFNDKQKSLITKTIVRHLKIVAEECPPNDQIYGYADDLFYEICVCAEKGSKNGKTNKK